MIGGSGRKDKTIKFCMVYRFITVLRLRLFVLGDCLMNGSCEKNDVFNLFKAL